MFRVLCILSGILGTSSYSYGRTFFCELEIAPGKYAVMKIVKKTGAAYACRIKYENQVIRLPDMIREDRYYLPRTIMLHNEKIYAIWDDHRGYQALDSHLDFLVQEGGQMREISSAEFPRSIVIHNVFFPGEGKDPGGRTDYLEIERQGNNSSLTASIRYHIESGKPLHQATAEPKTSSFLEDYIARYNPVRLRLEEMKVIPDEKADFHEPDTEKTDADTVRNIISGIVRKIKGFVGSVRNRLSEYEEERESDRLIRKQAEGIRRSGGVVCEISPDLDRYGMKADGAVLMSHTDKSLDNMNFYLRSAIPLKAYFRLHAYDRKNELVGTFTSVLCYEARESGSQLNFNPDSDFDQNRITKLVLSVKPD